ncbi:hypothetical protein HK096_000784, partial [Nowakowskiella sp. JEL0078]
MKNFLLSRILRHPLSRLSFLTLTILIVYRTYADSKHPTPLIASPTAKYAIQTIVERPLGPITPTNDDLILNLRFEYMRWHEADIIRNRDAWKHWINHTYPLLPSFNDAHKHMQKNMGIRLRKRGVAIFVGNMEMLVWLKANVGLLRKYGCHLPIEVWGFRGELEQRGYDEITKLKGVEIRFADDPMNFLPLERGNKGGYHVK